MAVAAAVKRWKPRRLVDLIYKKRLLLSQIPSAAAGELQNNIAMGLIDEDRGSRWDYYETTGGTVEGRPLKGLTEAQPDKYLGTPR